MNSFRETGIEGNRIEVHRIGWQSMASKEQNKND